MTFLETVRLRFRHWHPRDRELAMELWCNPEVTRLFASGPVTPAQALGRLEAEITKQREHGVQYWPMFLRRNGPHKGPREGPLVGCCGLTPRPPGRGPAPFELGFHLLPSHWGRGYATESARAVIAYAFDVHGAPALFAGHHPDNAASARVLRKLGFVPTRAELFEGTGLMHPSYLLHPNLFHRDERPRRGT